MNLSGRIFSQAKVVYVDCPKFIIKITAEGVSTEIAQKITKEIDAFTTGVKYGGMAHMFAYRQTWHHYLGFAFTNDFQKANKKSREEIFQEANKKAVEDERKYCEITDLIRKKIFEYQIPLVDASNQFELKSTGPVFNLPEMKNKKCLELEEKVKQLYIENKEIGKAFDVFVDAKLDRNFKSLLDLQDTEQRLFCVEKDKTIASSKEVRAYVKELLLTAALEEMTRFVIVAIITQGHYILHADTERPESERVNIQGRQLLQLLIKTLVPETPWAFQFVAAWFAQVGTPVNLTAPESKKKSNESKIPPSTITKDEEVKTLFSSVVASNDPSTNPLMSFLLFDTGKCEDELALKIATQLINSISASKLGVKEKAIAAKLVLSSYTERPESFTKFAHMTSQSLSTTPTQALASSPIPRVATWDSLPTYSPTQPIPIPSHETAYCEPDYRYWTASASSQVYLQQYPFASYGYPDGYTASLAPRRITPSYSAPPTVYMRDTYHNRPNSRPISGGPNIYNQVYRRPIPPHPGSPPPGLMPR